MQFMQGSSEKGSHILGMHSMYQIKEKTSYKHVSYRALLSQYGKAIPLQAWTGPEGSRRVRLSDFKTIST
jgi:hypothetical protein